MPAQSRARPTTTNAMPSVCISQPPKKSVVTPVYRLAHRETRSSQLARSFHLSSGEAGYSTLVFGLELLTEGADQYDFGYRPHALTCGPIVLPDLRTDFLGHVELYGTGLRSPEFLDRLLEEARPHPRDLIREDDIFDA
jgi:hypothetical protein